MRKITAYSGYVFQCPGCARAFRAETKLVAAKNVNEHMKKCLAALKKVADAAEAEARQGKLF